PASSVTSRGRPAGFLAPARLSDGWGEADPTPAPPIVLRPFTAYACGLVSEPACGSARYGNEDPNATSFASIPSLSESTIARCPLISAPSSTWTDASSTSSESRRPFGNPALSPAS